jgi:hypothetical protein
MAETPKSRPVQDRDLYVANRAKFLPKDLLPYEGQWVAWSLDGSRIVAHHDDLEQVERQLEQAGLTTEDVIFDRIPPGGVVETML